MQIYSIKGGNDMVAEIRALSIMVFSGQLCDGYTMKRQWWYIVETLLNKVVSFTNTEENYLYVTPYPLTPHKPWKNILIA